MPSAAGITISYEGKRRFDAEETCQYCSIQNCCNDSDSMQSSKFPTNNGPVSLRIATNHAHHTCTTPVTELPGHRGSDRIRFLYPGCCSNVENTNHQQPQITTRGRSTQRQRAQSRGRLVQLSSNPVNNDGFHLNPYPMNFAPRFNNGHNNLPPPHPLVTSNKNHQQFPENHLTSHPYAGSFLPKKFANHSNTSGTTHSTDNSHPSVLLSTATIEDDSSNKERPSRWSRHRGRARKRSPSARQRASASVIRQQDCSPPPVQRDRPPSPPSSEEAMRDSPPLVLAYNGRNEFDKKECPLCQPRYSQSPEKLGVRPILSKKLSVATSSPFVHEMVRDPHINEKHKMNGYANGSQQNRSNRENRHEKRRRARSEYRPTNNNTRRGRQASPDINMINNMVNEKHLVPINSGNDHADIHRQTSYVRFPKDNLSYYHGQHYCCSTTVNTEKEMANKPKHESMLLSFTNTKHHQMDLNGNEDRSSEAKANEYEEPKQKTCKENLRKKFSMNGRSISKASKNRRRGRKEQENSQGDELKSPGLIIRKESSVNTIDVSLQKNVRKASNISRSKSRSRFGEIFNTGLQTIWPAKAGIWLPQ